MVTQKKQKKAIESINSRLALVMKSGKFCLGLKQTLKVWNYFHRLLRKGHALHWRSSISACLNLCLHEISIDFDILLTNVWITLRRSGKARQSWLSSPTTPRLFAVQKLSTMPCWPRPASTTTLATTWNWALPAVNISECAWCLSRTPVTRTSLGLCQRATQSHRLLFFLYLLN